MTLAVYTLAAALVFFGVAMSKLAVSISALVTAALQGQLADAAANTLADSDVDALNGLATTLGLVTAPPPVATDGSLEGAGATGTAATV